MTIYSLDRREALRRLRALADRLRQAHPDIEQIQLVGSLARGDAAPGSDADLLVIVSGSDESFEERIGRLLADLPPVGIGVDLLPFPRAEYDRRLAQGDPFLRRLSAEAVSLG